MAGRFVVFSVARGFIPVGSRSGPKITTVYQVFRMQWFDGCFAAERG